MEFFKLRVNIRPVREPGLSPSEPHATDHCCPGLFEDAPAVWLHMLIRSLSPNGMHSLFRVSRQLALAVVRCARTVYLRLTCDRNQLSDTAVSSMVQLLQGASYVVARVDLDQGWKPWPAVLNPYISKLTLESCIRPIRCLNNDAAAARSWLRFAGLAKVQELECIGDVGMGTMVCLCEALEDGQLPSLQRFVEGCGWSDLLVAQRLAFALCSKVRHLTSCGRLSNYMTIMTSLRTVELSAFTLGEETVLQMCMHPSLQTVTMTSCEVRGDYSSLTCNSWHTLVVNPGTYLRGLPRLPLGALQSIRLTDGVYIYIKEDLEAIDAMLQHGQKVVCEPADRGSFSEFFISGWIISYAASLQLLRFLHDTQKHTLVTVHTGNLGFQFAAGLIPAIWQSVPAFVTRVLISDNGLLEGGAVWHGLPKQLEQVQVTLGGKMFPISAACSLVSAAPAHLKELVLYTRNYSEADKAELQALATGLELTVLQ